MGLFDRFLPLIKARESVAAGGVDPFSVKMEKVLSPTRAVIDGRETIIAGSNNYLGMTWDESCIEAAIEAVREGGTGTTGSRIANGSYAGHRALEEELAAFLGFDHCMVLTTGYQANLGIISTVAGPKDYLLIDADSHASIYDACRLGSATVIRFKHNDPQDLANRLKRLENDPGNKVVVVEGIYSMLGDTAPLKEIAAVKREYGAYLLVDEAHSLGVLGDEGRGLYERENVKDDVDFVVGTFSKSLGAVGGFCASSSPEFEILRVACRAYMFSASLPPSVIASVRQALKRMQDKSLRANLWRNVDVLYDGLKAQGFSVGHEKSPIVSVDMRDPAIVVAMWQELLRNGVYVNLALPPATPNGMALLRCSVTAAHTRTELEQVVRTFVSVADALDVFGTPRMAASA
jgi:8-amino-7-oxononanoate synthase